MANIDIFGGDAFSMTSMTAAINKLPYHPRTISNMGIFEERGVDTTSVWVEEEEGIVSILPTAPRGGVPSQASVPKRKGRYLEIPHIPHNATIPASAIQNSRAFGSESVLETMAGKVNAMLSKMLEDHKTTLEYQRMGALTGSILDADGATELLNLYTAFGTSEQTQDWDFDATAGSGEFVQANCLELRRLIDVALGGTPYDRVVILCSSAWFAALLGDGVFREIWNRPDQGATLRDDIRSGVTMAGCTFIEYRGAAGIDGVAFIAAGEARAFPIGVPGLYQTWFAPADNTEAANTVGLPVYAMQEELPFKKGIQIATESNPLSVCTRPRCLIKLTNS